jgi:zinc transport system permease protein
MVEIFEYAFMQHAVIAGFLVSIAIGIMGSLVVVNRMVFLAGGIAHTAYGGIGIAIYFGFSILIGSTLFAVLAAIVMSYLTFMNKERIDSIIGVIWAAGMSIGIVLIDLTPGYQVDLMSYLFGSILAVPLDDIYYMAFLDAVIVTLVVLFFKSFVAVSYDIGFAALRGVNVKFFHTLMLVLAALTVVIAIRVVGLILVIALLTIPPYIAEKFTRSLVKMMALSTLLSMLFMSMGLLLAYYFDISSGAAIVLFAVLSFTIVSVIKREV